MKSVNKIISIFLSALMLITSVPTSIFADGIPVVEIEKLMNAKKRRNTVQALYQQGYVSPIESYVGETRCWRAIPLNGGEDISILVPNMESYLETKADKGDYLILDLDSGDPDIISKSKYDKLMEKRPSHLPEGWVVGEVEEFVVLKKPLYISDQFYPAGTAILINNEDVLSTRPKNIFETYYVKVDENLGQKLLERQPTLTEGQLAEIMKYAEKQLPRLTDIGATTSLQISHFVDEIRDIELRLSDIKPKIHDMGKYTQVTTIDMVKDLQKELYKIGDKYFRVAKEMHFKSAGLSEVTTSINPANKSLIHDISYAYADSKEISNLWSQAGQEVNNIIANMAQSERRLLVGRLEEYVESLESLITTDLHSRFRILNGEKESLFKALEAVTQDMPKENLYKMIINTLDEGDRAGINLIMKAGEKAPSARQLAKGIQDYLKRIGEAKPGFINRLKLIRDLKRFSKNVDGRIEYVSKVTRLDPLEVEVGKGMVKTERGLSSMLKSVGPVIVVGVVLTAATIVDVNAQNVFPKSANPRRMHNIKKAIENDQDIAVSDALDFYVGHFDENQSVIEKSNAHYMNMVRFLVLAQQANNDKAKIFNAMDSLDPEVPGANLSTTSEVSNAFDVYMENNPIEQVLSQEGLI